VKLGNPRLLFGVIVAVILCVAVDLSWGQKLPNAGAAKPSSEDPQPGAHQLDNRKLLILPAMMAAHQKRNMREHLAAVQQIVAALSSDDFAAVERAARKIGYSEQMGQMCNMMGAATPGFTAMALNFHHTADGIVVAARGRDRAAVLTALSNTLATCTNCHAIFKQEVVDQQTWRRLTQKSVQ